MVGRKATLIDWVTLGAVLAVFTVLFYRGITAYVATNGAPRWLARFDRVGPSFAPLYRKGYLHALELPPGKPLPPR